MRTILCYGDSNTWGYLPISGARLGRTERWPGALQAILGDSAYVIEEGLSGRTSAYDDPLEPHLNGLAFLPVCLATHEPIDVVVIMLGTNDPFLPGGFTAYNAAAGVGALVDLVAASTAGPGGSPPQVLVVVPPPMAFADPEPAYPTVQFESDRFSEAYAEMVADRGCAITDLRGVVESSPLDGIHFDAEGHAAIARAVADALPA
jgi:lysophospholipase L1-like esterase